MSFSVTPQGGKPEKWIAFHDLLEYLAIPATSVERAIMIENTGDYALMAVIKDQSIDIVSNGIIYTVTNLGRGA